MSDSLLPLLTSLPISHPSLLPLIQSHRPFAHPSNLSQGQLTKFINRLNTLLLSRNPDEENDRLSGFKVAQSIVEQDEEGWTMSNYGKGWVGVTIANIASTTSSAASIPPALKLIESIILASTQYPAFERETIHPIMGKLSISLGKLLDRTISDEQRDWSLVLVVLETIRVLLLHSPANYRPLLPTLKPLLYTLVLQIPIPPSYATTVPYEIRQSASELIAALHVTAGKAQSPAAWAGEMRDVLGGIGRSVASIATDAWEEDPLRVVPPTAPASLPELPADPSARLPIGLDWLEGYVQALLTLLKFPTSRPVPVPIAHIISAGLRCLSLTLDTPTVSYISPQHHAALLASLPRIWIAGLQLLGAIAIACGDHLLPHLGAILDHTIWLAERLPASMTASQTQLLRFHHLLFTLFPPALVAIDYPTRLLRLCLQKYSPLLDSRLKSSDSGAVVNGNGGGGGKRGKKRARGAEDGLVGGLEGRDGRSLGVAECNVIAQALKIATIFHPTPLLPPSLLTFSVRLHLSLFLTLQSIPSNAFKSSASLDELRKGVSNVLEESVQMTQGENGTSRGWKTIIYSVLTQKNEKLSKILHPSLPPLMRPLPPLSALHHFGIEGEEEKKLRKELGFAVVGDTIEDEDEDGAMEVEVEVDQQLSSSSQPNVQGETVRAAAQAFGSITSNTIAVPTATPMITPLPKPLELEQITPPVPIPVPIPIPAPSIPAITSDFISSSTTRTSSTTLTSNNVIVDQVAEEDSDGPLPELDSGSDDDDDDMLDDDDE